MYPVAFRRRAVELVKQGKPQSHVATLLGIGRMTLHRGLNMKELAPPKMGPKTNFYKLCPEKLAKHVEMYPDAYQHERAKELGVSNFAVWYGLRRLGIKKSLLYAEKNDNCRSEYLEIVSAIPEQKRVYVDETGFDAPLYRRYAYAIKGQRVQGERTGKRFARTSLIAGLWQGKHVAPFEFKGYCDTDLYNFLVENCIICYPLYEEVLKMSKTVNLS